MSELISVIVPIYNVEEFLPHCIESLIHQTYKDLEIILVDDGSKDESGTICDSYAEKDSRIKVIHKVNGGLSSARNAGIEVALGKYIGFVDGDDYVDSDMYEELFKGMQNEGVVVSCCALYKESKDANKIIGNVDCPKLYSAEEAIKEVILDGSINISVCCKLFAAEVFKALKFPLGALNEDEAIVVQTLMGGSVYHIGTPKYHYIFRENSITNQYGLKGAQALYHNMSLVSNDVEKTYPDLKAHVEHYQGRRSFDVLMIYNVAKLKKDDLYRQARKMYKSAWRKLYSQAKGNKERSFYVLERIGLLKILFYFK